VTESSGGIDSPVLPAPPGFQLLETKLHPPWTRPGLIARQSVTDRLLASDAPIFAVVAPPGYGKTTLLAAWSERTERRSAWVSLDERDNDAGVLLSYIAAALDRVEPIDPVVLRSLASPAAVDAGVLRRLVVAVSAMRVPFALVLDHVEVIENQRCRDALAEIALNVPPGSQLAMASRMDPPVPTARLRAQGMVLDIGVSDLAMGPEEARQLLAAADVVLSDEQLNELVERTEGWPVGLYLATLALEPDGPRTGVGLSFHGDDRLIADYLQSEVLTRLSPARAAFLIRTSVLDRLCGPLCDAVLGAQGSREMLESLEREISLLVPLDRRRHWYRYHHLLRDLLRAELLRSEPDLVPRLHDRAAAWFETNGEPDLAIEHAQAAGDADRAARLVVTTAQLAYVSGRIDTAMRWLSWFEARGLIDRYPHVAVVVSAGEALLGRVAEAERMADLAASGSFDGKLPDGSSIQSWLALLDAGMCRRGVAQMRTDAEFAREHLAPGSGWTGAALFALAMSRLLDGDDEDADALLTSVVEVCLRMGIMPIASAALAERAALAIERHDWAAAVKFASDAMAIVETGHLDAYLYSIAAHSVAARIAAHQGDRAGAQEHLVRASRVRPLCTAAAPYTARFLLDLSRAYLELGDPAGARAVLRQIREILRLRPDLGVVPNQVEELEHMLDTIRVGPVGASSLTAAELRLLPLLTTHLSYQQIGERLYVSRNTVKTQALSVFRKLGVSSRSDAVERAEEIGMLGR
jgi:LuxR family transcriptional regulator, maltose regulon positive regulatory protein